MTLTPNPAVNSDAPVYAFVLSERLWRRAGYLIRCARRPMTWIDP